MLSIRCISPSLLDAITLTVVSAAALHCSRSLLDVGDGDHSLTLLLFLVSAFQRDELKWQKQHQTEKFMWDKENYVDSFKLKLKEVVIKNKQTNTGKKEGKRNQVPYFFN